MHKEPLLWWDTTVTKSLSFTSLNETNKSKKVETKLYLFQSTTYYKLEHQTPGRALGSKFFFFFLSTDMVLDQ